MTGSNGALQEQTSANTITNTIEQMEPAIDATIFQKPYLSVVQLQQHSHFSFSSIIFKLLADSNNNR